MAYTRVRAVCLVGVDGHPVTVEVHIGTGKPAFVLTGMPDQALQQSRVRIRSAFANCGLQFPDNHTVVNLLPASVPKSGSGCDLAIATGLMAAMGTVPGDELTDTVLLGELGLDGRLRPVRGVLPMLLTAQHSGARRAIVPIGNLAEAALVSTMTTHGADSLAAVAERLRGERTLPQAALEPSTGPEPPMPDLSEVVGQHGARRALEIAAAGRHHMYLLGPPGTGKTMLAERLPSILPPLTRDQALESTALHSVAELLGGRTTRLLRHPPFSAPHHSATMPAMVGGGSFPLRPGAASIAHNGVLFLDEAPEFKREVLDALRQLLESGEVHISRAAVSARFPARIQLVLAANPCPCGAGDPTGCGCTPSTRRRYLARLSGPLLDRVDIRLQLNPVPMSALLADTTMPEGSTPVAARVAAARAAAAERWQNAGQPWRTNSQVPGSALRSRQWRLPRETTAAADRLVDIGVLTGRGYDRVLRVAWSAADVNGRTRPGPAEIEEAAALRLGGL